MNQWFWIMTWTDENLTTSLFRSVRVEILPKLCVCQSSMEMTESFSKMKLVPQTKCSPVEILSKAGEWGGSKWKKIERPRIIFPDMKHSRFNSKAKTVKCLTCVESYFHISFKQFPPPRKIGVLNICSIWMSWFTALRLLQSIIRIARGGHWDCVSSMLTVFFSSVSLYSHSSPIWPPARCKVC